YRREGTRHARFIWYEYKASQVEVMIRLDFFEVTAAVRRAKKRCRRASGSLAFGSSHRLTMVQFFAVSLLKKPSRSSSSAMLSSRYLPRFMSTFTAGFRCAMISSVLRNPSWDTRGGIEKLLAK